MKEHHKVEVVRIEHVLPHGNAERLEIIPVGGYEAISAKGQFKVGDLAYYIPPDSVVPEREEYSFLWGNAAYEGGVPVRKRRITAKKLRGVWSEGLLMSVDNDGYLRFIAADNSSQGKRVSVGDDVAEFLGIIHYDTESFIEAQINTGGRKRLFPRSISGWVELITSWFMREKREGGPAGVPEYGVEAFKNHKGVFEPGEQVIVTEKIHGSNARFTFRKGLFGFSKFYVGSHFCWRSAASSCKWRRATTDNPWIETWCRRYPGYVLYGEVVPTQQRYHYGSGDKIQFFVFDIRTPTGRWMEKEEARLLFDRCIYVPLYMDASVPLLYMGPFDEQLIKLLVDGKSTVIGADHIREGVVVNAVPERTSRGLGRVQLKIVSNDFLAKDAAEEKPIFITDHMQPIVITDRMQGVDSPACEQNTPHP